MGKSVKKAPKSSGKKRFSIENDTFFDNDKKRRRNFEDDNIESSDEDEYGELNGGEEVEEEEEETAAEVRKRIAEAHLEKLRKIKDEQDKAEEVSDEDDEEREREREGERDTWVANVLQQEQLEDSGRVRRLIASRYLVLDNNSVFV